MSQQIAEYIKYRSGFIEGISILQIMLLFAFMVMLWSSISNYKTFRGLKKQIKNFTKVAEGAGGEVREDGISLAKQKEPKLKLAKINLQLSVVLTIVLGMWLCNVFITKIYPSMMVSSNLVENVVNAYGEGKEEEYSIQSFQAEDIMDKISTMNNYGKIPNFWEIGTAPIPYIRSFNITNPKTDVVETISLGVLPNSVVNKTDGKEISKIKVVEYDKKDNLSNSEFERYPNKVWILEEIQ